MAPPPSPEWAERILHELADLRRRMAELEEQLASHEPSTAKTREAPVSEKPASPAKPPPLPPERLATPRAPAGPSTSKPAEGSAKRVPPGQPAAPAAAGVASGAKTERIVPDEGELEKVAGYLDRLHAAAESAEKSDAEKGAAEEAKPDAAEDSEKSSTPADASKPSLEQIVGTKWMLLAGVALLLLAGVFFFRYAYQQGWITPPRRCLTGFVLATVMLGLGEWAVRRKLRAYAVALFGVGIVWHYYTAWAASPNGPYFPTYEIIGLNLAFVYMCLVTAAGVVLSLRTGFQATAVIACLGAFATPLLLRSGQDRQVALVVYLLTMNAAFLSLAWRKRWDALGPIALAGTGLLYAGWWAEFYRPEALTRTGAFSWMFVLEFLAYSAAARRWDRARRPLPATLAAVAGTAGALALLGLDLSDHAFLVQVCLLDAIVLAVSLWARWDGVRLAVLAWTLVVLPWHYADLGQFTTHSAGPMAWCGWIWLLFAMLVADLVLRALYERLRGRPVFDAVLGCVGLSAMFLATYDLLARDYAAWRGLYAAAVGGMWLGLGWLLGPRSGRRAGGRAYVLPGLILLTMAIPIHFDHYAVTVAWGVYAAVLALLANALRSRIVAINAWAVFLLAVVHFLGSDVVRDQRLAAVLLSAGGVDVTARLVLAGGLTAVGLVCAWLTRWAKGLLRGRERIGMPAGLVIVALCVWCGRTACELPVVAATWWWLVPIAVVAGAARFRRSGWLGLLAGVALLAAASKWFIYDTLALRLSAGVDVERTLVLNAQSLLGLVLAGGMLWSARQLVFRDDELPLDDGGLDVGLRGALAVGGVLAIVWAGSFEVDRFFTIRAARWTSPDLARQMALSLWWSVYAAGVLWLGFAKDVAPLRYLAIGLLAITVGKVFVVDMAGVEAVYRILSFLGLGAVLLAGSLLYHRRFRGEAARVKTLSETGEKPVETDRDM